MDKLKVAVVGIGHLGQAHARVCSELPDVELVAVADPVPDRAGPLAEKFRCRYEPDYRALPDLGVQAVSIVTPTVTHYEVAEFFISRGIPALVEKPMTACSAEGRKLVELARARSGLLQVGHIERFNPAVMALDQYRFRPRYIEAVRVAPISFRSLDVGVVMDLMIHDIDIVAHFARSSVASLQAVGVNVVGAHEDIANARLTFKNGCVATLTASRVATKAERRVRIFAENAYYTLDYMRRKANIYEKAPDLMKMAATFDWRRLGAAEIAELREHFIGKLVTEKDVTYEDHEPLKKEWEYFVRSVLTGEPPLVTGEEALAAIEVAEWIVRDIGDFIQRARDNP